MITSNFITSATHVVPQLRHKCKNGHTRLIAKVVSNKLEFVCENCDAYYYWDENFLQMLIYMLKAGKEFSFTFE